MMLIYREKAYIL